MDNEKMTFNLAPGAEKVEITLREAPAAKVLDVKPPVRVNIDGTIESVKRYLEKRVGTGQFKQEDCHILSDRDAGKITLIVNESDEYGRRTVAGKIEINPAFAEFGINENNVEWTPSDLGMFLKMNRSYFPDRGENMRLVSEFMNFTASVNGQIERSVKENGDRTDNYSQVVNSNLPGTFRISIPVIKGGSKEAIEVETFAKVSGREVSFFLISPMRPPCWKMSRRMPSTVSSAQSERLLRTSQSSKSNNMWPAPLNRVFNGALNKRM